MTPFFRLFRRALLAALLLPAAALAQTTIHVPADQPTIQAGINAARTGDTVLVAPGTYYENIDFQGKAITVRSSSGASVTIIDGQANGYPTVSFLNGEPPSATLQGFTVQNGGPIPGSSTYCPSGSCPYAAGISLQNSAPTIVENVLTGNRCNAIRSDGSSPDIFSNTIQNTQVISVHCGANAGAGVWLDGNAGSAFASGGAPLVPVVMNNTIQNNIQSGAGLPGGNDGGAAIAAFSADAEIEDNLLRNNVAHDVGGAIFLDGVGGVVAQNVIVNNQAAGGGGAIAVDGNNIEVTAIIANNTIVGNTDTGTVTGSYEVRAAQLALGHATSFGVGIILVNNIVAGNTTEPAVSCATGLGGRSSDPRWFTTDHNLFFNSGGPLFLNCPDPTGTYGNINADPKLAASATGDFHLSASSPAIDAGNTSVFSLLNTLGQPIPTPTAQPYDFDLNPRLQNATGTPSPAIDIGAYEYTGAVVPNYTAVLLVPAGFEGAPGVPIQLTAQAQSPAAPGGFITSGSITFFQDGVPICAAPVDASGKVVCDLPSGLPLGIYHFLATFSGSGPYPAQSSVQSIGVVTGKFPVNLTLSSSPEPSLIGQSVTFTTHISATDTTQLSPIYLTNNGAALATLTPDATGKATFSTSTLTAGSHQILASYPGDSTHAAAGAQITQLVIDPNATITTATAIPNPALVNQAVVISAHVAAANSVPTGSITYSEGSTTYSTVPVDFNGNSSLSISTLSVGTHTITVTYAPIGTFTASSTTLTITILAGYPTTTTVTATPNPANLGQTVTLSAHVASTNGTPTGSVTFSGPSGSIATVALDPSGNASTSTATLPRGTDTLTATYVPVGTFAASSGTFAETINGLSLTAALAVQPTSPSYGDNVTLTATLGNVGATPPTGTVTFYMDNALLSTANVLSLSGRYWASMMTTVPLPGGNHSFTCTYSGDLTYNSANCAAVPATIQPDATALQITYTPTTVYAYAPTTLTAALTQNSNSAPVARAFSFLIDGANVFKGTPTGSFSEVYAPTAGSHTASATFAGDADYAASAANIIFFALPNSTTTTLTASPNPAAQGVPVSFTVNVADTTGPASAIGAIALVEAGNTLASATAANGQATFSLANLSVGTHQITAVYTSTDNGFLSSTSTALTVTINPSTFTLTIDPSALSIQTQHHRAVTLTLTSIGAFSGPVSLSCKTPLPPVLSCEFAQATVNLAQASSTTTQLTLETDAVPNFYSSELRSGPSRGGELLTLAGLLPLALFAVRRKRPLTALLLLVATFGTLSLSACADRFPDHTPPGTYDIEVDATSGLDQITPVVVSQQTQSAHIKLTVTP